MKFNHHLQNKFLENRATNLEFVYHTTAFDFTDIGDRCFEKNEQNNSHKYISEIS